MSLFVKQSSLPASNNKNSRSQQLRVAFLSSFGPLLRISASVFPRHKRFSSSLWFLISVNWYRSVCDVVTNKTIYFRSTQQPSPCFLVNSTNEKRRTEQKSRVLPKLFLVQGSIYSSSASFQYSSDIDTEENTPGVSVVPFTLVTQNLRRAFRRARKELSQLFQHLKTTS